MRRMGLKAGLEEINLGGMPRKPSRPRTLDPVTIKVAEMIDLEVDARVGPNATFEEREDAAAVIAGEVAAALGLATRSSRDPKSGG